MVATLRRQFAVAQHYPLDACGSRGPKPVVHSDSGTPQVCAAAVMNIARPAAPTCRMGVQLLGVRRAAAGALAEPYFGLVEIGLLRF